MGYNANNYLAVELEWTDFSSPQDMEDGMYAFRGNCKDSVANSPDGYEYKFGIVRPVSNGKICVIDGYFHYDHGDWMNNCQWTRVDLIFKNGSSDS